jgi:hypothetical protein
LDRGIRDVEDAEKRSPVCIGTHQGLLGQPIQIRSVKLHVDLTPAVFFRIIGEAKLEAFAAIVPEIRYDRGDLQNLSRYRAPSNEVSRRGSRSQIDNFLREQRAERVVLIDLEPIDVSGEPISPTPPAMLRIARSRRPDRSGVIGIRVLGLQMRVACGLRKYGQPVRPKDS